MHARQLTPLLRSLTRAVAAEASEESDCELIRRFLDTGDEVAFQALVRRHGPMVYRVCLRVAGHDQDAEDAFQATFLVLARDLRSLRDRASLASWLHGVARRVALKARAGAAARRRRERAATAGEGVPPPETTWAEVRAVLDEELARLPERWRQPLVLCYLEGRTQDEAARALGWSHSTLRRRLGEARDALAGLLRKRGVGPGAFAAVLVSDCSASALAPRLLDPVLRCVACGGPSALVPGVPERVLTLTKGVVPTMVLNKLKLAATAVVLAASVSAAGWAGLGRAAYPAPPAGPDGPKAGAPHLPGAPRDPAALPPGPMNVPAERTPKGSEPRDPGTPGPKADPLRGFSKLVHAPVLYKEGMLVLATKDGVAAVVFTTEVEGGVEYKFRYESADGKVQKSGTGKVTEKDAPPEDRSATFIEAGPIPLRWSHRDDGLGWVYYDPAVLRVHPANAADFEDRVEELPFGRGKVEVLKLDLKRFLWK